MITLRRTSWACPEQYDAYANGGQIGYLRLRGGCFTVESPDVGGALILSKNYGDEWAGEFDEDDRKGQLQTAVTAICRHCGLSVNSEWKVQE